MVLCKILIIDDDEDDVEILADAFTESGVNGVHYVNSAMQAFIYLQSLEANCLPKLIVTDLFLPGITGAEFLKDLKLMELYKHIHVVILSSVKSDREIERYRELGALDYHAKPSSYDEYVKVAVNIKNKAGLK
jgi:CheY-like chemotaxis protein